MLLGTYPRSAHPESPLGRHRPATLPPSSQSPPEPTATTTTSLRIGSSPPRLLLALALCVLTLLSACLQPASAFSTMMMLSKASQRLRRLPTGTPHSYYFSSSMTMTRAALQPPLLAARAARDGAPRLLLAAATPFRGAKSKSKAAAEENAGAAVGATTAVTRRKRKTKAEKEAEAAAAVALQAAAAASPYSPSPSPAADTTAAVTPYAVGVDKSATAVDGDYDAQAITVLEGLEPVRKRPGMYIGNTGPSGLNHLIFEVVDNAVDEALAGHCDRVEVVLHKDGSVEVRDNGRGIPCSPHPRTGKSALETVLCVLHAGSKFGGDDSGYKVSGGLHGVGVSVVNALSDSLVAQVCRDGRVYQMAFARGVALGPISERAQSAGAAAEPRGTRITFKPDPTIFKTTTRFNVNKAAARLDELAYLNPGLTLTIQDLRDPAAEEDGPADGGGKATNKQQPLQAGEVRVFRHDGGIRELVAAQSTELGESVHPSVPVIYFSSAPKTATAAANATTAAPAASSKKSKASTTAASVTVEVAFGWSAKYFGENVSGFANGIRTNDGGSHIEGFKSAVAKTLNAQARKLGKLKEGAANIPGDFLREGLTAVVSVKVPEPEFEGQTKSRLGNPEVRTLVDGFVSEELNKLLEWNPQIASAICTKALEAQAAAAAARAARDMVRRKSVLMQNTMLPGKLADCSSRETGETELFVVEGDSAAGSAKQARDRRAQAILPLRGKVLNIEKTAPEKIYKNSELQALISALGLGTKGAALDRGKLRYGRVVLMTDADVDGSHIRMLLLTFLYRYQPELIDAGHVYIACPPLFKVVGKGKKGAEKYLYSQEQYNEYVASLGPDAPPPTVQRFKGLGEMMPEQLWETTMDPARRRLRQVTVADAKESDRVISTLMGKNVTLRKDFIVANSLNMRAEDLDV